MTNDTNREATGMVSGAAIFCTVQMSQLVYVHTHNQASRAKLEGLSEVGPFHIQCAIDMGYLTADGDTLHMTDAGHRALPVLLDMANRMTAALEANRQRTAPAPGTCPNCRNAPILSASTNLCGPCLLTSGRRQ